MAQQVKEVARRLGIHPQTLYFWERVGLIPPPARNEAGYRCYGEADIERLTFILRAKKLGLTLAEIQDMLALKDRQSLTCRALAERLARKLQDLQVQMAALQNLYEEIAPLLAECTARMAQTSPDRPCVLLEEKTNSTP